jgi:hypothetical protein
LYCTVIFFSIIFAKEINVLTKVVIRKVGKLESWKVGKWKVESGKWKVGKWKVRKFESWKVVTSFFLKTELYFIDKPPSPDCNGNPFLFFALGAMKMQKIKKIAVESWISF